MNIFIEFIFRNLLLKTQKFQAEFHALVIMELFEYYYNTTNRSFANLQNSNLQKQKFDGKI